MVLDVGRRLWRWTEPESDRFEPETFVKRAGAYVFLVGAELKPARRYLLRNIDELCPPPPAPFGWIDIEPINEGPLHRQVGDDAPVARRHPDGTTWSDDAIEDLARALEGEGLPSWEVGVSSDA